MMSVSVSSFAEQLTYVIDPSKSLEMLRAELSPFLTPKTPAELSFLKNYALGTKNGLISIEAVVGSRIYSEAETLAILRSFYPSMPQDAIRKFRNAAVDKVNKIVSSDDYLYNWLNYFTTSKSEFKGSQLVTVRILKLVKFKGNDIAQKAKTESGYQLKPFDEKFLLRSKKIVNWDDFQIGADADADARDAASSNK